MENKKNISNYIKDSMKVKEQLLTDVYLEVIEKIAVKCLNTLETGNKILICGNGGSAADSQHFAAELTGRYKKERRGLAGIALTTDTSALTAIGNDYGYNKVFSRQLESIGQKGDVLFSLSTSGNSENLILAIQTAKDLDIESISLLGKTGGEMKEISDLSLVIPSDDTARIQECHILIIHIICELIEEYIN
jgi:D-sedoheptulose 7-phosphate isomerase